MSSVLTQSKYGLIKAQLKTHLLAKAYPM